VNEYANPIAVSVPATTNLPDAVFTNADIAPHDAAFSVRDGAGWRDVTMRQFAEQVSAVAKGLIASGVAAGDRVALMSRTRYEWTLLDYAIWSAGAVTVPIYETSSPEQVAWYLTDSAAVAVVVETADHAAVVATAAAELANLGKVWQIDAGAIETLAAAGQGLPDSVVQDRRRTLTGASLATVIYTSGTTGRPKGCELTHGNLVFDVAAVAAGAPELVGEHNSTLLFLPLAHIFARVIQCFCVTERVRMGHTADVANLLPDLAEFRPTFVLSVPRVFEKIYNGARRKAHSESSVKGRIFDAAEMVALAYSRALDRGGRDLLLLRGPHLLFDRLVYGKLRAALGGKVRYAVSGGAPLGERLGHFFRGIGVLVLEGYGLTETTAGATLGTPGHLRVGTVGRAVPGTAIRIDADGEVLIKGPHVFRGYWHNEDATREVFTEDGFFRTGDIGQLDQDGYLTITGRKKEILVTAGGKNIAPAQLEDRLRAHPLIGQCMVVGDRRPFVGLLVTIDPEAFPGWKAQHVKDEAATVADLREDPDLLAEIDAAVAGANKSVSHAEGIKKFRILPVDFTEAGGQLTPTLKMKRNVIVKEHEADIAAIYS
jgi:long-chain acyl-CoA synthetase